MKFRFLFVVVLLSLAVVSNAGAQATEPAPSLAGTGFTNNQIALSPIVTVRHNPLSSGYGADGTVSHYFTRYLGFSADADVYRSDQWLQAGYGFRGGPTVRFRRASRLQPFARALFGYARLKEIQTGPTRPYIDGFSYVLGGGADVMLVGRFAARLAADFENDPGVGRSNENLHNRLIRIGVGVSYHFGKYGR